MALARKWRPRTFSQLLGQDHIKTALINSLEQSRLHHAYLFTGTRGVGKTSVARLFAKSLNCERGISALPCLECSNCVSIEQGRFIDLIEVDGASRTRVEDTRELLENVQYVPSSARFKIYLIDEVHMLSQHSFNALLKTLEEPPEHVKFLLATTDPQKLPITVLSRCLQFNLKHLSVDAISAHLRTILEEENLSYEAEVIELLSKAAKGSVRDALSLLDQVIVTCNGKLSTELVKQLLGYSQLDYALQLLQALGQSDPTKLLSISRQIALEGGPFQYVMDELLNYLHQICIYQSIPNSTEFFINAPTIQELSRQFTPEDTQLLYQIIIKNQEDIHLAPSQAIAFEMMLLRMYTFKPAKSVQSPLLTVDVPLSPSHSVDTLPDECHSHADDKASMPSDEGLFEHEQKAHSLDEETANKSEAPLKKEQDIIDWSVLISQLNLTGLALSAAENAEFIGKVNQQITLRIQKGFVSVFTAKITSRLEEALSTYYKEPIKIILESIDSPTSTPAIAKQQAKHLQHQLAEASLQEDPFLKQLKQEFSAEIVKTSIAPLKDSL